MQQFPPIFFITSALSPDGSAGKVFDFFVYLTAKLCVRFSEIGYRVILFTPPRQSGAAKKQLKYLESICSHGKLDCSGLIIDPFDKGILKDKLVTTVKDYRNLPILTIDQAWVSQEEFCEKPEVKPPLYAKCDEFGGGQKAAESAISYSDSSGIDGQLDVLIVKGLEGSKDRIDGFENRITAEQQSRESFRCRIHKNFILDGKYEREAAHIHFHYRSRA